MPDCRTARTVEDMPALYTAAGDILGGNLEAGRADKVAVIDRAGETTYGALAAQVDRMANALRAAGLQRGQRLLLCLLDSVAFPIAFLGAIKAGIVPVPLNTMLPSEDYRWLLSDSEANAVFVSAALTPQWEAIRAGWPDVQFFSDGAPGWADFRARAAQAPAHAEAAQTRRDDVAFWLYSSGSTGKPKGVVHRQSSMRLTANLYALGVAGYREADVVLSVAKLFFAYGLGNALTFPFAAGATAVLLEGRATPEPINALLRRHGVTILGGVPTFFANWLAHDDGPKQEDMPSLRLATSAGEALPAHLGQAVHDRFGIDVLDGLGSTEMLHIFISQQPGQVRYGCTGKIVPGYEARIIADDGTPAPVGAHGELQVKGPTSASLYWRNPEKTAATFVGEWTRTGDQYVCDEEGWYSCVGRRDDMMKVGGIYVSPLEVEEALACHASVLEAAVVPAPDEDGLIKPKAYVVLKQGFAPGDDLEAELKAHVKARLAPYKYPRWFAFVSALPRTPTGKLQRFKLRDVL
ncbi:MAG: benzoate-CoA ligase family protein [Pseudomonadota bacterium]